MDIFKLLGGASIATIVAISAVVLIIVIIKLYVFALKIKFLETQIKKNELQIKELEYKRITYYKLRENEMINVTRASTQLITYLKDKNRQEQEETQETE